MALYSRVLSTQPVLCLGAIEFRSTWTLTDLPVICGTPSPTQVNMGLRQHPRRASSGLFTEPTRGLEEKLHQLMTHMFEGLCVTHQVASTQALLRKLKFLTANAQIMAPTKPR